MKKIIAPVDFSDVAANAAIFAGNLAEFYGAELWLYHSYEMVIPVTEYGYSYVSIVEMQEAAEHELNAFKDKVQGALRRTITINIKAENATLTEGLTALCDEVKPEFVVMGLSGKNALTRLVVGSNTIRAIHQLTYPVLVIPPKAAFTPVRKIGFACDYKKVLETTPVQPLKKLVLDFNAELYVLNIEYNNTMTSDEKLKESQHISELLYDLKPAYQTIISGDITNGINWFADKEKIDWMVMIPKKHNLVEKVFGRSQTKELLHHTHLPVLCMHE
ncbi:universal stress protein [Ferruginibacter sp. SUN106]|uniref:universal stress protein n=1 Tax=Ferruginibacter sp. SUN106 TaxID=2978348 RepID=UPI003D35C16C